MEEPENAPDSSLAASFVTYIDHREALQILSQYHQGFQVTLIRGWREDSSTPTFRVLIYKLKKEDTQREYYEWEAEGMSNTPIAALKTAHERAQRYLTNPPTA